MKKKAVTVFAIILLVFIDQLIKSCVIKNLYNSNKQLIHGFLNFTYTENTGGAFGIGNSKVLIFIIANIVLIGLVTIILFTKFNKVNKTTIVSLVLVIAGGIGNLVDRIFRGYVIDYIDINQLFKYPIFNFADICVVVGITLIIICVLVHKGEY